MVAFLAGIPIAGNILVALSATLTVYLSESAKRHCDPTVSTNWKPEDIQIESGPVASIW
jgi:hypothetical protein